MVALALYRPGPLTGGLNDRFVARYRARSAGWPHVEHLHPSLEPLLADTYGVILYQEQVLRIAHELAGLILADADLLRRAMSHFDPGKQMQPIKERFTPGRVNATGCPGNRRANLALDGRFRRLWLSPRRTLLPMPGWPGTPPGAKRTTRIFFMAAVLANWGGYYSQRVYLNEARRLGLNLREPHINHARREFSVQYLDGSPVLFMGLDQVRDLGARTQQRILQERPFHSLADFLVRVDPRAAEVENLIQIGAAAGAGRHSLSIGTVPQPELEKPAVPAV